MSRCIFCLFSIASLSEDCDASACTVRQMAPCPHIPSRPRFLKITDRKDLGGFIGRGCVFIGLGVFGNVLVWFMCVSRNLSAQL